MPTKTQPVGLEDQLSWVSTTIDDLHHRACALERLVDSSLSLYADADSAAESNAVTVQLDRDAWCAAVDAATTPRPPFPGGAPAPPPA